MRLNLQISDGWIPIEPNLIHLILPLTDDPISGIKRAISKNILIKISSQSIFKRKLDGIIKNIDIDIKPTETNNNLREI